MATLAEIRAKLKEAEQRSSGNSKSNSSNNGSYPFWNLKEGDDSLLRFLPDGNPDNTYFWVERAMIKLPFSGIKGESDNKSVIVQVPCVEMYGDKSVCPILAEVRGWFKDPALEELGRAYWKKRSYIFQGFVLEDGLKESDQPENPIRRFVISPQIFKIIQGALLDPELDELPTDYVHGLDFRVKKANGGKFADYSTSNWSRRERPLSDEEHAAINQHKLFNLADFLPKKPTEVELKVMKEMFEASVNGEQYDTERWGQYFKPAGMNQNTGDPNKRASSTPTASTTGFDDDEFETVVKTKAETPVESPKVNTPVAEPSSTDNTVAEPSASGDSRAQDIMARIRSRQK